MLVLFSDIKCAGWTDVMLMALGQASASLLDFAWPLSHRKAKLGIHAACCLYEPCRRQWQQRWAGELSTETARVQLCPDRVIGPSPC